MGFRIVISSSSREYLRVKVTAKENGVVVNPTSDTVEFAFVAPSVDVSAATWTPGSWETDGTIYYARILVGPDGGVVLSDGTYAVWVRINQAVEFPVHRSGLLDIL